MDIRTQNTLILDSLPSLLHCIKNIYLSRMKNGLLQWILKYSNRNHKTKHNYKGSEILLYFTRVHSYGSTSLWICNGSIKLFCISVAIYLCSSSIVNIPSFYWTKSLMACAKANMVFKLHLILMMLWKCSSRVYILCITHWSSWWVLNKTYYLSWFVFICYWSVQVFMFNLDIWTFCH